MGVATHPAAMAAERPPTRAGLAAGAAAPAALWGRGTPKCGRDRIVIACGAGQGIGMASNRTPTPSGTPPIDRPYPSGPGVLLSAGDFAFLMDELDSLRAERRMERNPASLDGAELLTTLRTAGVEEARVEQVAALIELASMVEDIVAVNGGAGIGSIVKVQDRGGRSTEYELVGRSLPEPRRPQVMLGSPTGKALLGAPATSCASPCPTGVAAGCA